MELSILDSAGLPEGGILSVRSGPTRRQSPLPCTAPFRLPAGPWPLRIDVLALLGKSTAGASLGKLDPEGCCKVPLESRDGRQMSVTLQVFEGKAAGMRPKTAPNLKSGKDLEEPEAEASPSSPVRRRDTEAEARAYLDRHRLHEFMHALFELLLRERPTDPYSFIAARFREAALREPSAPHGELALPPLSVNAQMPCMSPGASSPDPAARHSVVSATPSARKESSSPVPEGSLQVTIRNMRGRSAARMTVHPNEKIGDLKLRLQSTLGVPATSQSLLWWAETLPNDTTIEDHDITPGASIHLVCSTRDPRFRMALSGSSDGGLMLWSLENGELLRDFSSGHAGQTQKVQAVAVDWTNMRAISGLHSGSLHDWDIDNGRCLGQMEGHEEEVNAIDVDWSRMRALSGSSDGTAKLWNLEEHKCVLTFQGGSSVYTLAVDWAKMRAFGGLRNGLVRLWDMTSGNCIRDFSVGASAADAAGTAVSTTAIDFVGNRAVSGLEDGHLAYWHFSGVEDAAGERAAAPPLPTPTTKMLLAHYSAVRTIVAKWVDSGSRALCGSDDGSLSLWRLESQECVARFARHVSFVWAIYADWARDRAVSGAFDGCIKLWDLRSGDCLRTLQGHSRPVRSIAAG